MTSPPVRTALVTGAGGQLGLALQATVPRGWRVIPCDHRQLDVTNDAQVHHVIGRERPGLVVNAAAYTAVDAAESEPERAAAVNTAGAANVARAARETGARLIHLSTDFVFDGCQGRPYGPNDPTNPLGVYGRTKLEGEHEVARITQGAAVILRSAWIYGIHGKNFVLTMLRLMREKESVRVVADQVGTPTWDRGLADAIWGIAERSDMRGRSSLDPRRGGELVRLCGCPAGRGAGPGDSRTGGARQAHSDRRVSHASGSPLVQRSR